MTANDFIDDDWLREQGWAQSDRNSECMYGHWHLKISPSHYALRYNECGTVGHYDSRECRLLVIGESIFSRHDQQYVIELLKTRLGSTKTQKTFVTTT